MWEKVTTYFGKDTLYEASPGKVLKVPVSLFDNICSWDKINFFNSLRIKKSMEDYYHYSKNDRKFKNLLTLVDNNLGYSVFQAIEKTKIGLSDLDMFPFQYSDMGIEIDEDVPIEGYNAIIDKDIQKISAYLDKFMLNNKIGAEDIDSLFLTGGTSMVRGIKDLFQNKFPQSKINSGDNFTSVAKGLAYSGYLFEDDKNSSAY
jgi:hypothetical chaperone protein